MLPEGGVARDVEADPEALVLRCLDRLGVGPPRLLEQGPVLLRGRVEVGRVDHDLVAEERALVGDQLGLVFPPQVCIKR